MLLVVTRGTSVRPSDKHSFMPPLILSDLMNDAGIAFHSRAPIGRGLVTVADVLNNHITDFGGALFATHHFYIIPEGGQEVKNYFR